MDTTVAARVALRAVDSHLHFNRFAQRRSSVSLHCLVHFPLAHAWEQLRIRGKCPHRRASAPHVVLLGVGVCWQWAGYSTCERLVSLIQGGKARWEVGCKRQWISRVVQMFVCLCVCAPVHLRLHLTSCVCACADRHGSRPRVGQRLS